MKENKLRNIIREEIEKVLTVEITMEKVRDGKTGQPLTKPEITKEEVFLPSFLTQVLSFQEGALRGLQEDNNKRDNKIEKIYDGFPYLIQCLEGIVNEVKQLKDNRRKLLDESCVWASFIMEIRDIFRNRSNL